MVVLEEELVLVLVLVEVEEGVLDVDDEDKYVELVEDVDEMMLVLEVEVVDGATQDDVGEVVV